MRFPSIVFALFAAFVTENAAGRDTAPTATLPPAPPVATEEPETEVASDAPPEDAPPRENPVLPAPPNAGNAPGRDWRAIGYFGSFGRQGEQDRGAGLGGFTFGASFQYRSGPLVGGALVEVAAAPFAYAYEGAAAVGGLGGRPVRSVRVQLLGALGAHRYFGVGEGWGDPGASGTSGYVGARASISCLFGRGLGHFELGVYGDFQDDLSRQRVRYSYPTTGLGGVPLSISADQVIGTSKLGFGLEIGGTHDIL